jgi:Tol biopolymer transport system component
MEADGGSPHPARLPVSAVWSHSGRWVVFPSTRQSARGYTVSVVVANRDGSHRRRIGAFGSDPCFDADWSPDDARIAFTVGCDVDLTDLYVARRTGSARRVTRSGHGKGSFWAVAPSWSPDGRTVAVEGSSPQQRTTRITLLDPAGKARRPIPGPGFELGAGPWTIHWTPNGKRIFFLADHALFVIGRNGSGRRQLSPDTLEVFSFDLSPDGKTVVLAGKDGNRRDIYTVTAAGAITKLTDAVNDSNPSWSPDGRRIVFERATKGVSQIYVMNGDGSDQRNVSRSASSDSDPRWVRRP